MCGQACHFEPSVYAVMAFDIRRGLIIRMALKGANFLGRIGIDEALALSLAGSFGKLFSFCF